MDSGRKRHRSVDDYSVQQRKIFVSQKIVDQNDKDLMEKVYGKLKLRQIS